MFFERGVRLPGRSEVRLAVTTPCRLQLCTELAGWDSKCLVTPVYSYTATIYGQNSNSLLGLYKTFQTL